VAVSIRVGLRPTMIIARNARIETLSSEGWKAEKLKADN
jgi:hypothetical protein